LLGNLAAQPHLKLNRGRLMIQHWHNNRWAIEIGTIATEIPMGPDSAWMRPDFGFYV
jgi:hypothetical protein